MDELHLLELLNLSKLLTEVLNGSHTFVSKNDKLKDNLSVILKGLNEDENPRKYEKLIEIGFPDILVYLMIACRNVKDIEVLPDVLNFLVHVTNNSEEFCKALMNTNFPEVIIEDMIKYSVNIHNIYCQYFAKESLLIIYNVIRWQQLCYEFQQQKEILRLKEVLIHLSLNNEDLKMVAALNLGFLTKDNDKTYIKHFINLDLIKSLIEYISMAIKSEARRYDSFDVWELLLALRALSKLTLLKETIIYTNDAISTILSVISSESSENKEIEVAFGILRNLSLSRDKAELLLKQYDIKKSIKPVLESKNESRKKLGVDFFSEFQKRWQEMEHFSIIYDVFISFSDNDKDDVNKIEEFLRKSLRVYSGSGNNVGITGIKRSRVVILALSKSYNDEEGAKSAAICAYNEKKSIIPLILIYKYRPFGWLRQIVDMNKSVDFSNHSIFKESLHKLCQMIHESGIDITKMLKELELNPLKSNRNSEESGTTLKYERQRSSSRDPLDNKDNFQNQNCPLVPQGVHFSLWTEEEVSEWLISNQLSGVNNKFNEVNGKMLQKIITMRDTARETYYNLLNNSLKMTFIEIIKFECALDNLKD